MHLILSLSLTCRHLYNVFQDQRFKALRLIDKEDIESVEEWFFNHPKAGRMVETLSFKMTQSHLFNHKLQVGIHHPQSFAKLVMGLNRLLKLLPNIRRVSFPSQSYGLDRSARIWSALGRHCKLLSEICLRHVSFLEFHSLVKRKRINGNSFKALKLVEINLARVTTSGGSVCSRETIHVPQPLTSESNSQTGGVTRNMYQETTHSFCKVKFTITLSVFPCFSNVEAGFLVEFLAASTEKVPVRIRCGSKVCCPLAFECRKLILGRFSNIYTT
ncbi:hypothetical protein IE53DRAFT_366125 [Violaceomyces palustris]|uniref:Uncharacterized protein n=1 Tax=Violaceomyces palustris TaxID=1673888 RepID=A0ACD0P6M2_9BASI|nr:hypothetical protein IE53DRAFT_366125 [Violaceomyces palustris]